jgi:hypothetical protein
VWVAILALLAVNADNECAMLDRIIARAHQHSAAPRNQANGKRKGGPSSKFHVLAEASGNPLKILQTAGQVQDLSGWMRWCQGWRQKRCWRTRHLTRMSA